MYTACVHVNRMRFFLKLKHIFVARSSAVQSIFNHIFFFLTSLFVIFTFFSYIFVFFFFCSLAWNWCALSRQFYMQTHWDHFLNTAANLNVDSKAMQTKYPRRRRYHVYGNKLWGNCAKMRNDYVRRSFLIPQNFNRMNCLIGMKERRQKFVHKMLRNKKAVIFQSDANKALYYGCSQLITFQLELGFCFVHFCSFHFSFVIFEILISPSRSVFTFLIWLCSLLWWKEEKLLVKRRVKNESDFFFFFELIE